MGLIGWAILLLLIGLAIIVAELFLPSHGLLGVMATLAIIGSLAIAVRHSYEAGAVMLLTVSVIVPAMLAAAVKYWPQTPLGRRILVPRPAHQDDVLPETESYRKLPELIGQRGIARGEMLPSGTIEIHGRRYDAVSDGQAINAGQAVEVLRVETQRLVVRGLETPLEAVPLDPISPATPLPRSAALEPPSTNKSASSPFEEPLI